MKGRFEVITAENPKEVKIFADYDKIPDNIIEIILFKPSELDDEGNISPAVSPSVAASPVVGDKTHCRASVRSPTAVLLCGPLGVEGMITHPVRCCSVPPTLCRELPTPPVHGAQQMDVHPVRRVRHVVSAPHTPRSVPRLPCVVVGHWVPTTPHPKRRSRWSSS